jgi:signal peptidase
MMGVKYLHQRKAIYYPLMVFGSLVAAFLLDNLVLGPKIAGIAGNYLLPVVMWSLLIILLLRIPQVKYSGKLRLRRLLRWGALICVLIAILGSILQGFLGGFGKSPYDHSLLGITINLLTLGSALAAIELCRSWLLNRFFYRRPWFGITCTALFFTLLLMPWHKLASLSDIKAATEFIGISFFPGLAQNILTTYLAYLGGPVPAMIYRGGILAFENLSPILPGGDWIMAALFDTIAPLLALVVVQQIYKEAAKEIKITRQREEYLSWIGTCLASVLIMWFCLGVFSYSPRVVLSGSMMPSIKIGDVVIVHKVSGTAAEIGDIVMFPLGSMKVTHRIVAVEEKEGERFFATKGDANSDPDSDLLPEKNVQGEVVMVIPKIGCVSLLMRGAYSSVFTT